MADISPEVIPVSEHEATRSISTPPLDGMLVHHRVTCPNVKFAGTHLIYAWLERGTVRVKCLAQSRYNHVPAMAQYQTTPSGVEQTNHAPLTEIYFELTYRKEKCYKKLNANNSVYTIRQSTAILYVHSDLNMF